MGDGNEDLGLLSLYRYSTRNPNDGKISWFGRCFRSIYSKFKVEFQYFPFPLKECFYFLSAKEITVCTTQKKPLSCSYPGSNIAVTGVFWGRRSASVCPSDDGDTQLDCFTAPESEGIVKGRCEGKESCELEARHALLQNPGSQHCPGVNKYLTVNYTCVPDAKEEVMCDSENSTLNCPASWKIGVNSVFWGRQSTTVCPAENGQTMCTGAPESLGIVKKSCDGLTKCDVHASYDQVQNGAENCPGVQKYLIINYSCKPHPNIGNLVPGSTDFSNRLFAS